MTPTVGVLQRMKVQPAHQVANVERTTGVRYKRLATITVLLAGTCLVAPSLGQHLPAAYAATTCVDLGSNRYFDGTDPQNSTNKGAEAVLDTQQPALCTTGLGGYSTAWSMSQGYSAADGWAQSGILLNRGNASGSLHYFSEQCQTAQYGPCNDVVPASPLPSGNHVYREEYDTSVHRIKMYYDSVVLDTTSFDPELAWQSPWGYEWNGEVNDSGNDVPGTSAVKELISSIMIKPCYTCNWTAPTGLTASVTTGARYSYQWLTPSQSIYIWTSS